MREVEGKLCKCISIPLEPNGIVIRRKREPHLYALLKERAPNNRGILFTVVPYIYDKKIFGRLYHGGWWRNMYYLGTVTKYYGKINEKNKNCKHVSLDEAMENGDIYHGKQQ